MAVNVLPSVKNSPLLKAIGIDPNYLCNHGVFYHVLGDTMHLSKGSQVYKVSLPCKVSKILAGKATPKEKGELKSLLADGVASLTESAGPVVYDKTDTKSFYSGYMDTVLFTCAESPEKLVFNVLPNEGIKSEDKEDVKSTLADLFNNSPQPTKTDTEQPVGPPNAPAQIPELKDATYIYQKVRGTSSCYFVAAIGTTPLGRVLVAVAPNKGGNDKRLSIRMEYKPNPGIDEGLFNANQVHYLHQFGLGTNQGYYSGHFLCTNTTPSKLIGAFLSGFPDPISWETPVPSYAKLCEEAKK